MYKAIKLSHQQLLSCSEDRIFIFLKGGELIHQHVIRTRLQPKFD